MYFFWWILFLVLVHFRAFRWKHLVDIMHIIVEAGAAKAKSVTLADCLPHASFTFIILLLTCWYIGIFDRLVLTMKLRFVKKSQPQNEKQKSQEARRASNQKLVPGGPLHFQYLIFQFSSLGPCSRVSCMKHWISHLEVFNKTAACSNPSLWLLRKTVHLNWTNINYI